MRRRIFLWMFVILASSAQAAIGKKPITPDAYDRWHSVVDPVLSNDGKWVAYSLVSGALYAELIVRSTRSDKEFHVSQGVVPRPESFQENRANPFFGRSYPGNVITPDSEFVLFPMVARPSVGTNWDMGILRLSDGHLTTLPGVLHYKLSAGTGRYLAGFLFDGGSDSQEAGSENTGKTLLLRNLCSGVTDLVPNVEEYVFDSRERYLAYIQTSSRAGDDGVFVRRLADGQVMGLLTGVGVYRSLTFDDFGEQLTL